MIKFLLFISILINIPKTIFATSIGVVNIENLIDNNLQYQNAIKELEINQNKNSDVLKSKELELEKLLQNIEESRVLLNDDEINKLILDYNNELNLFSLKVDTFNSHYQQQIVSFRDKILKEIIVLIKDYAKKNNFSIILDSNNYIIASNEIDITKYIQEDLNEIVFILEVKSFETD